VQLPSRSWRLKPRELITVDVMIPVLNEAHVLERSVRAVHDHFSAQVPLSWQIVIVENGSTDGTAAVARRLCEELPRVDVVVLTQPGRGRALRMAWTRSTADIVSYTDVDLSTALSGFPELFGALIDGGYDLAVGSRLAPGARTTRSFKRQIISRGYNALLKLMLGVRFSDAQTGFKAVTREVVQRVLPLVEDQSWFLDTEMLVIAERLGYRIADLPVEWIEDDDSRVKIVKTAIEDVRGILRLRRTLRRDPQAFASAAPGGTEGEGALR
jgi:glycosyltransferase involved in cell wall biosynthesis